MIVVISGVAGSGKSTIGRLVSARLGWDFIEGDDYHPELSRRKMAAGVPLTDEDRLPWLETLNGLLVQVEQQGGNAVLACSALRQQYRDILLRNVRRYTLVWLEGSFEVVRQRLATRLEHYFPGTLLESQYDIAERPEGAMVVDVGGSVETIVSRILFALKGQDDAGRDPDGKMDA
jgi:carbohydrate kinase (thermoresistant glucokinase family)